VNSMADESYVSDAAVSSRGPRRMEAVLDGGGFGKRDEEYYCKKTSLNGRIKAHCKHSSPTSDAGGKEMGTDIDLFRDADGHENMSPGFTETVAA